VRAFKERNQIGRFNPELAAKAAEQVSEWVSELLCLCFCA
jgi:hypothetical protein